IRDFHVTGVQTCALPISGTTTNSVSLSWTASTDNIAVAAYDIYMNGTYHSTVTGTSANISGLTASTTYSFYVIAKDSSGNSSAASNTISATTLAGTPGGSCRSEEH